MAVRGLRVVLWGGAAYGSTENSGYGNISVSPGRKMFALHSVLLLKHWLWSKNKKDVQEVGGGGRGERWGQGVGEGGCQRSH